MQRQRRQSARAPRTWRVAAAALLAFFLGGAVVCETVRPQAKPAVQTNAPAPPSVAAAPEVTADPWQSDELKDFHAVVQWESWVTDKNNKRESSL